MRAFRYEDDGVLLDFVPGDVADEPLGKRARPQVSYVEYHSISLNDSS